MHLVEFVSFDGTREVEKEFSSLDEAVRFADGIIEEGGSATVFTTGKERASYIYTLCEIIKLEEGTNCLYSVRDKNS